MGIFNKGKCELCSTNCNIFNYKKIKDGIICNKCEEMIFNEGIVFSDTDLLEISKNTLKDRIEKNNNDINCLLQIINPNIVLKKDEKCYYVGDALSYNKKNIITRYGRRGGSSGIRLAKGIVLGKQQSISVPIREDIIKTYPAKFYITNLRLILIAEKFGFELYIDKITSMQKYKDAFEFFVGNKTYTVLTNEVKYISKICQLLGETQ